MGTKILDYKPISIELIYSDDESLEGLRKSDEFLEFVYGEMTKVIKHAIKANKKELDAFYIKNINYFINIKRHQFKNILNTMLQYYVNKESYQKCGEIKKIIDKL
jgi:hypothetical protein